MSNKKITDLDALTTPAAADLLEIVDDVGGTATSKKITWANLFKSPILVTPLLGTPTSGDLTNCDFLTASSIEDEAEITLDTGKTGQGWAMAGDNEEYINFRFTAAGVVTVISNSANAINTDTDGFLCVYDAGSGIAIKNRLGATKTIRYVVNYS